MPVAQRGGLADVVYVLCLIQASFLLLAGLGEVLLMGGNGAYLLAPVAKAALFLVLGTKILRYRRWALVTLIVLESISLVGFGLQMLAGLVPILAFSPTLVGLVTGVALPVGLLVMCARLLRERRQAPAPLPVPPTPVLVPAQDPYTGWEELYL